MNYSEALSFAFQDKDWAKKAALGGFCLFIAVFSGILFFIGFFALGYYLGILRNVIHGNEKILPEWENNWGKFFADGLMGAIILLINVLVIGGVCAAIIVALATSSDLADYEMVLGIVFTAIATAVCLIVTTNLCFIQFAKTNDFAAAFRFAEIADLLKNDFANFVTIVIFVSILNAILFLAGLGIFSPFTNFWGYMVQAHLFGQYAKRTRAAAIGITVHRPDAS
jgi:hypothetical protein